MTTAFLTIIKEKLKGNNLRTKSSRHFFEIFGTFPHIFTLFQSLSEFFPPGLFSLELRGFTTVLVQRDEKRIKENKKKKTKPFCTFSCCTFVLLRNKTHIFQDFCHGTSQEKNNIFFQDNSPSSPHTMTSPPKQKCDYDCHFGISEG